MGRNSEWFSMQNETVTSVELRNVGKWLCQVKGEWENQIKDGTQMVEDDDVGQLQEELGDEASDWKRSKACRTAAGSVALAVASRGSVHRSHHHRATFYSLTCLRRYENLWIVH